LNHDRVAVTRNREIDVHVFVGEFSGDTDRLTVAGFESAGEGHDGTEIGWGSGEIGHAQPDVKPCIHLCRTALFVLRYGFWPPDRLASHEAGVLSRDLRGAGVLAEPSHIQLLAVDRTGQRLDRGRSAPQICIARFATAIAASFTASDIVGWAWQVRARSSAEPPNSISTAASWIISPAPKPTM
jgi:hypothetical protein